MNKLDFGKWLEEERLIRGWSQRELARRMDISGSHISNVESGGKGVTAEFCHKLARVFSADVIDVLKMAGLIGNSIPSKPITISFDPATQRVVDLMTSIPLEQRELVMKITELVVNGNGMGRASPKQKAETQPL